MTGPRGDLIWLTNDSLPDGQDIQVPYDAQGIYAAARWYPREDQVTPSPPPGSEIPADPEVPAHDADSPDDDATSADPVEVDQPADGDVDDPQPAATPKKREKA